jgi:hypothetical protein
MNKDIAAMAITGYVYSRIIMEALLASNSIDEDELGKALMSSFALLNAASKIYPEFSQHIAQAKKVVAADAARLGFENPF